MSGADIGFRDAHVADLPAIVRLLADDPLGAQRERFADPLPPCYRQAFEAIDADPNNELVVVELDARVIGVLQLTYVPSLTYQGRWRAQIESVRIDSALRSSGVGRRLFEWAIERARARACHLLQLTCDKQRPDAIRFYRSLGFDASHEGMKLKLDAPA